MLAPLLLLAALPAAVLAGDTLETNGFSTCLPNGTVKVDKMNIKYDRTTNLVNFDVGGTSEEQQNVTMSLVVSAYGKDVYRKDFNPCDKASYYPRLCPIPKGHFASTGSENIPDEYASQIPSIAFNVPDLAGQARLEVNSLKGNQTLACIVSQVGNGKTLKVPAVSVVAAGVLGAALVVSGLAALGAGGNAGASTPSPTFGETLGWFHSMAMNGMLNVRYPQVYQSFSTNFGFSTGLISWHSMQASIDGFRKSTGGNLTHANINFIENATLVHADSSASTFGKRSLDTFALFLRDDIQTSVSNSTGNSTDSSGGAPIESVSGLQAFVEELRIPQANVFMTVLLVFAIVIAAIIVGILLFKVILETWALFGSFPKKLTGFRKRYWWLLAKTITNLILVLYGIWTLYCVHQFVSGDSWAAKALAGVTFGIFTAILGFFTFRIYQLAHRYKKLEGDTSALFEDKETWVKYSIFYDVYKKNYWWLFVPAIVYMFAKGCVIAAGVNHGIVQAGGQLIVEALFLAILVWYRPYSLKSGNWINIFIQVVRVLSVVCILVFVEELDVDQSTSTITGVVLIVMQSVLTGLLAILIAVNAIIICCKANPHRKQRKAAEKMQRDLDNLTPLDARNSLLMDPTEYKSAGYRSSVSASPLNPSRGYDRVPATDTGTLTPTQHYHSSSRELQQGLLTSAASMGGRYDRSMSPPADRRPTMPNVGPPEPYGRAF